MSTLPFTTLTSSGESYRIDFPLHPETGSASEVGELMTVVLDAVTQHLERQGKVSNGDVLQALAMTLAIRTQMLPAQPSVGRQLAMELVTAALDAATSATSNHVGRA